MATRTIQKTDCDRCLKEDVPVKEFRFQDGYTPEPAGGRSQPDYVAFDLCGTCMQAVLTKLGQDASDRNEGRLLAKNWGIKPGKLRSE